MTQQHGREKTGGTGEKILYAHISKYSFSPQEEEEKRETRERRAGGAHGNWSRSEVGEERHAPYWLSFTSANAASLHIALDLPQPAGPRRIHTQPRWNGRGEVGVSCREAFGHDYGQHASGGPSPLHRARARKRLSPARWLVFLVQASYTPPTSTPTLGASTKAAHQDSSRDTQTESEVFHPYKRRTARGRGSSGTGDIKGE
jgi:hypothetical protein